MLKKISANPKLAVPPLALGERKKYFVMLVTKNDQTWQSYLVKSF